MNEIFASVEFMTPTQGGLVSPMQSPTRSLVLIFASLNGERGGTQVGVLLTNIDGDVIHPGERYTLSLRFWVESNRVHATDGAGFAVWYAGRIVGHGEVLPDPSRWWSEA